MRHQTASAWLLGLLLMALLASCNLGAASVPTPAPTPNVPRVEILDPPNNRQIIEGVEFDIDIVARDESVGISRVELSLDDVPLNEATPIDSNVVPVFRVTMNWLAQNPGLHVIEAVAYRPDGTASDPYVINIDVLPRDGATPNAESTAEATEQPDA